MAILMVWNPETDTDVSLTCAKIEVKRFLDKCDPGTHLAIELRDGRVVRGPYKDRRRDVLTIVIDGVKIDIYYKDVVSVKRIRSA